MSEEGGSDIYVLGCLLTQRLLWHSFEGGFAGRLREGGGGGCGDPGPHGAVNPPPPALSL